MRLVLSRSDELQASAKGVTAEKSAQKNSEKRDRIESEAIDDRQPSGNLRDACILTAPRSPSLVGA